MDDLKAKQQLIEKIKASSSILVTVSNSPSVDSLAAALALTLLLDKLEKHPTAVFSGAIPPAINFLEPEKTFDSTTDSLRDFIIALDKSKADHLRYKVDGDAVKIFITPYKTTITSEDLEFSQGDYNVELVIALGVDDQAHIDAAIESHGQILHDADVVSVTAHDQKSTLGGIDWHDEKASSLSEMISGLAEALKVDKNTPLVDQAISTALLTGIVAETERFSNTKTSSQVMNVAAQLMGAGADPQLISFKLQEGSETPVDSEESAPESPEPAVKKNQSTLSIDHEGETLAELDKRVRTSDKAPVEAPVEIAPEPSAADVTVDTTNAYGLETQAPAQVPDAEEPTLGGALNATTEQAAADSRRVAEDDRNRKILTHSAYLGGSDPSAPASLSDSAPEATSEAPVSDTLTHSAYSLEPLEEPAPIAPPAEPIAVPAPAPMPMPLPMPPAIPDFSQPPLAPGAPAIPVPASIEQPALLGDILAPEPTVAPETTSAYAMPEPLPAPVDAPAPTSPTPANPAQFQIPGQQ